MSLNHELLFSALLKVDPFSAISLVVAVIALGLNWLNRRSQKSARIAIELFPKEDGIFLLLSNVGDRIAYDCSLSIEPAELGQALAYLPVIAPQRSYEAFLCGYSKIPSERIRVLIRYHDPVHKARFAAAAASFETSCLGEYRISLNKDFDCLLVER